MKRLVLPLLISFLIFTPCAFAEKSNFFVKANISHSFLNDGKGNIYKNMFNTNQIKEITSKQSKRKFAFGIGVGYNYLDNVRIDLTYEHLPNIKINGNGAYFTKGIDSALVNCFLDMIDLSIAKIFIGAGAGIAHTKVEGNAAQSTGNVNSKKNYSLAGAAYLGAGAEIMRGLNIDLVYSFRYLGKTKSLTVTENNSQGQSELVLKKDNITAHNLALGLRFYF